MNDTGLVVSSRSEMARLLKPFAGREIAAPLDTEWARYANSALLLEVPHPSRHVRERSEPGDRVGQLYDRMEEADSDLAGLLDKRKKAVLRLPRSIRAADSSPLAREVAQFVHRALSGIPQRVINQAHLLDAIPRGVAFEELIWEEMQRGPLAGAWVPVDMIDRPMHRFAFALFDGRLHIRRRTGELVPAPPAKFLVHASGTKDNPWGVAILDKLYWAWFLKRQSVKYWAIFMERFASPLALAKYPHRRDASVESIAFNEDQQRRLLSLLEEIRTGTGVAIPEGTAIEFLEAARSGDASYAAFVSWLTRAMALLLLGEVDTSGLAKGPGSFAKSEVSNDVRLETVQYDAHVIGSFESDTLVKWIVTANFGPDAPMPKSIYDSTDALDRDQRIKGISLALAEGEEVSRWYFRMTTQIPDVIEGEEVVGRVPTPDPPATVVVPEEEEEEEPPSLSDAPAVRLSADELADLGATLERRDEDFQAVVDAFVPWTERYFAGHRDRVLELWDGGAAIDGSLLSRLVDGTAAVAHAERLEAAQIHGMGWALLHVREDLEGLAPRLTSPGDFFSWTSPNTAIEFWAQVLGVSKEVFRALQDLGRRLAFAVAGVVEAGLLADLHQLLGRAIADGLDRGSFEKELTEIYDRHGVTPTSPAHAGLIYGNNVRQAAGAIQYRQTVLNPQVHGIIPYLVWWSLADDRVRARPQHNHQVVHAWIGSITHDFWKTWWSPAGHGCRCLVGTITKPEARRRGLVGAEPSGPWPLANGTRALPDPGFRSSPDLTYAVDVMGDRAQKIFEEAERAEAEPLIQALRALFQILGLLGFLGLSEKEKAIAT